VRTEDVTAFEIDQTEVTVGAYGECAAKKGCPEIAITDYPADLDAAACHYGNLMLRNYPMNCVTWEQANAFCRWAGKRLPTSSEWVRAYGSHPAVDEIECLRRSDECVVNESTGDCELKWEEACEVASAGRLRDAQRPLDLGGNVQEWSATAASEYGFDVRPDQDPNTLMLTMGGSYKDSSVPSVEEVAKLRSWAPRGLAGISPTTGFRCVR
jgi:formylglycine-generating enzyme required for sulfatase activity